MFPFKNHEKHSKAFSVCVLWTKVIQHNGLRSKHWTTRQHLISVHHIFSRLIFRTAVSAVIVPYWRCMVSIACCCGRECDEYIQSAFGTSKKLSCKNWFLRSKHDFQKKISIVQIYYRPKFLSLKIFIAQNLYHHQLLSLKIFIVQNFCCSKLISTKIITGSKFIRPKFL